VLRRNSSHDVAREKLAELPVVSPEREKSATLEVPSSEEGRVLLDGEFIGELPLEGRTIPAGAHTLEVRTPDGRSWSQKIDIRAGESVQLQPELGPEGSRGGSDAETPEVATGGARGDDRGSKAARREKSGSSSKEESSKGDSRERASSKSSSKNSASNKNEPKSESGSSSSNLLPVDDELPESEDPSQGTGLLPVD
jgi:hypothetical protein